MYIGAEAIGKHEARLLLSQSIGLTPTEIILNTNQPLDEPAKGAFLAAVERRKAHEPLQYIIGQWEFMGLPMITDSRALIPRPETELLVEEALKYIHKLIQTAINDRQHGVNCSDMQSRQIKILDVCTGSGCIAVAIARLADATTVPSENAADSMSIAVTGPGPGITITATDISHDALALAAENAALNGVSNKIRFMQCDLLNDFNNRVKLVGSSNPGNLRENNASHDSTPQLFDIIISNPPYIPTAELNTLQPELSHEPRQALDGGPDGLDPYRRLIPQTMKYLAPDGVLLLEIGPPAVEGIMKDAGYGIVRMIDDYAGLPRVLVGRDPKQR